MLAAVGSQFFSDLKDASQWWQPETTYMSFLEEADQQLRYRTWKNAIECTQGYAKRQQAHRAKETDQAESNNSQEEA